MEIDNYQLEYGLKDLREYLTEQGDLNEFWPPVTLSIEIFADLTCQINAAGERKSDGRYGRIVVHAYRGIEDLMRYIQRIRDNRNGW